MLFAGALRLNVPSAAVIVDEFEFFIETVTPGKGEPSLVSVTLPVTGVCAQSVCTVNSNPRRNKIFNFLMCFSLIEKSKIDLMLITY